MDDQPSPEGFLGTQAELALGLTLRGLPGTKNIKKRVLVQRLAAALRAERSAAAVEAALPAGGGGGGGGGGAAGADAEPALRSARSGVAGEESAGLDSAPQASSLPSLIARSKRPDVLGRSPVVVTWSETIKVQGE